MFVHRDPRRCNLIVPAVLAMPLLLMPWLLTSGQAACSFAASTISMEASTKFAAEPRSILDQHPNGGVELEGTVGEFAMASAAMIKPIADAARFANLRQGEAIGSALARSYRKCRGKEDALAAMIRQAALTSPNGVVRRAYLEHTDLDNIDAASKAAPARDTARDHSTIRIGPDNKKLPSPFAPLQLY